MTTLCADEEKIAEPSNQCNFEGDESPRVPVTMTKQQQEDDEEILKKLKIPWILEGLSLSSEER